MDFTYLSLKFKLQKELLKLVRKVIRFITFFLNILNLQKKITSHFPSERHPKINDFIEKHLVNSISYLNDTLWRLKK